MLIVTLHMNRDDDFLYRLVIIGEQSSFRLIGNVNTYNVLNYEDVVQCCSNFREGSNPSVYIIQTSRCRRHSAAATARGVV